MFLGVLVFWCLGVLVFEVTDILEGRKGDQGDAQKGQNSIWSKTRHLENYPNRDLVPQRRPQGADA